MDMIRHDDELIDLDIGIKVGHVFQLFQNSPSIFGMLYQHIPRRTVRADITKDLPFLLRADSYEIKAGGVIIIAFQSDTFPSR